MWIHFLECVLELPLCDHLVRWDGFSNEVFDKLVAMLKVARSIRRITLLRTPSPVCSYRGWTGLKSLVGLLVALSERVVVEMVAGIADKCLA